MSLAIPYSNTWISWDPSYELISDGGRQIQRQSTLLNNYLEGSASDWFPVVNSAFQEIRDECMEENWGGSDTSAITGALIALAENIVFTLFKLLPKGTPNPDILPESDGEICLSWSADLSQVFSVSVNQNGKINFAGQFARRGAVHAWQPIDASDPYLLTKSLQDIADHVVELYTPSIERS